MGQIRVEYDIPVTNPANGKQIATVPDGNGEDAKLAVDTAYKLLRNGHKKRRMNEVICCADGMIAFRQ